MEGSKAQVYHGTALKTAGGVTCAGLVKDRKDGEIKSKAKRAAAKKNPSFMAWKSALAKARRDLNIKDFVLVNVGPEGKALYQRAKEIYASKGF